MIPTDRIYVALDTTDVEQAKTWASQLKGKVGGLKIGKEYFTANGPQGVQDVTGQKTGAGMPLFLDLKFHDIPNTVASAIKAALPLKPALINVHACGGARMMTAAAEAAKSAGADRPLVLGVTVLTSMDESDLKGVGIDVSAEQQVVRLATLARDSGLDGVVCSAREILVLREALGPDFKLVVPGIRPTWASADDQRRVVTPRQAIEMGADHLVIGRPITGADDPAAAAMKIAEELEGL